MINAEYDDNGNFVRCDVPPDLLFNYDTIATMQLAFSAKDGEVQKYYISDSASLLWSELVLDVPCRPLHCERELREAGEMRKAG